MTACGLCQTWAVPPYPVRNQGTVSASWLSAPGAAAIMCSHKMWLGKLCTDGPRSLAFISSLDSMHLLEIKANHNLFTNILCFNYSENYLRVNSNSAQEQWGAEAQTGQKEIKLLRKMELHPARLTAHLCAERLTVSICAAGFFKSKHQLRVLSGVQFLPAEVFALAQGWKQKPTVPLLLVKRKLI